MRVFAVMLVAACAQGSENNALVSSETYGSRICWFNKDGILEAFLVVAQEGRIAVPYLISAKCTVRENYSSYGEGVLHHLNAIRMIDLHGRLQQALPTLTLSDNTISDQPVPSSNSKIYYFRAKVRKVPDKYMVIYTPVNIVQFTDMEMSFEAFLKLPMTERQNLQVRTVQ